MSDLPGNPHADKSLSIYNQVASCTSLDAHQAMYDMSCAQNLATLALAHEQRTANLISFIANIDDTKKMIPVVDEISKRLGLGE